MSGTRANFANMSPERRSEVARMGGKASQASGNVRTRWNAVTASFASMRVKPGNRGRKRRMVVQTGGSDQ